MSDFDFDSFSENDWDECGDLAWNEFDWERYLKEQDDTLHRYLAYYEKCRDHPERIDQVARLMGWDHNLRPGESDEEEQSAPDDPLSFAPENGYSLEPYTLHKNPVFVATKAIYLSLKRSWERLASDENKVARSLALTMQASLYRGEEQAVLGVQALDLGEYALAVSLFKRALQEINHTLALAACDQAALSRHYAAWRDDATHRFFDLREIWLRVIAECREELERPVDDEE